MPLSLSLSRVLLLICLDKTFNRFGIAVVTKIVCEFGAVDRQGGFDASVDRCVWLVGRSSGSAARRSRIESHAARRYRGQIVSLFHFPIACVMRLTVVIVCSEH